MVSQQHQSVAPSSTSNVLRRKRGRDHAAFPLTPALSPGERENRSQSRKNSCDGICRKIIRTIQSARSLLPLPGGERRGEGKHDVSVFGANRFPQSTSNVLALLLTTLLFTRIPACAATNLSAWIFPAPNGRLLYQPDALGNRILDASGVGYKGGTVPLPTSNTVPVKVTISPVAGDNTANIQAAVNTVSAMGLDANGF